MTTNPGDRDGPDPAGMQQAGDPVTALPAERSAVDGLDWSSALGDALAAVEALERRPEGGYQEGSRLPSQPSEGSGVDAGEAKRLDAGVAFEEVVRLREELAALQLALAKSQTETAQAVANASALRRMLQRAETDLPTQSTRKVLEALMTPLDHLDALGQHLRASEELSDQGRQAVDMLIGEWGRAMQRLTLEPFDAVGHPFDAERHELIARVRILDEDEGIVVRQAARGYLWQGRLLRSATVVVNMRQSGLGPQTDGER